VEAMMTVLPMAFSHLFQFLPLSVGKIDSDLLVCLRHDLMDAPASVAPYFLELRSRFIDNWRNLCHLFRCQTKLRAKPLFHSVAHSSWMVNIKEKMPSVKSTESHASDSTRDEYQQETGNEFPFQRFVHWENSS
jgi:hypothetical protein